MGLPANTERGPRGTAPAPPPSRRGAFYFIYSSVFLCFETKAQLMDSWRSEDPLPGATLMYCCPISAFIIGVLGDRPARSWDTASSRLSYTLER